MGNRQLRDSISPLRVSPLAFRKRGALWLQNARRTAFQVTTQKSLPRLSCTGTIRQGDNYVINLTAAGGGSWRFVVVV